MRIGGIGMVYPTYVYNPNTVSAKSMNKLSKISDDVLDKKVDYSETTAKENENPLRKGQTIDFEGILAKQMQQGQNRAARIMTKAAAPEQEGASVVNAASGQKQEEAAVSTQKKTESMAGSDINAVNSGVSDNNTSVMQMQRAIQAYEMFMTA